jgi:uncharacterized repeat protein (TIGR01451 family)
MKTKFSIGISLVLIITFLTVMFPAPVQAAPNWFNDSWVYRMKITVNHNDVPSDLTNFPVVINEINVNWKDTANSGHVAQTDGGDIVFTDSDGTTQLAHEIEKYTPATGDLIAWVKVPFLSSTADSELYIYYGNASCADQWSPSGTWSSEYKMVQHMKETTATYNDSTQFDNDGTPFNGVIRGTTGKIDGASDFDAIDDYVDCGKDATLNMTDGVTLEALVKGQGAGFSATNRKQGNYDSFYPQLQVVGDKIYYVWSELDGLSFQIFTGEMDTDGSDWSATQRTTTASAKSLPQLQVVGDKIYYIWSEFDGTFDQIWTAEMNVDGTGWAATRRTASAYYKSYPQLQVVGSNIYYAWQQNDGSNDQIWTGVMNTDGTGWTATQRTSESYPQREPQLQVVGNIIYFIWIGSDGTNYQIWTGEMNTDGSDWSAHKQTDTTNNKDHPQLQPADTTIYYAWEEYESFYSQISTGKKSIDAEDFTFFRQPGGTVNQYSPQLQVEGSTIYYVWYEYDQTNSQIWTGTMSTNDSGPWTATPRTATETYKELPQFQVVGSDIFYIWSESDGPFLQLSTGHMNTSGENWSASLMTTSINYSISDPQFQVAGSRIYYVWNQRDDEEYNQIWTGVMNTDGTGWEAVQRTDSPTNKSTPQLQVVGSKIYYVWSDVRIGDGFQYAICTAMMNTDGSNWTTHYQTTNYNFIGVPQFQAAGNKIYYVWVEMVEGIGDYLPEGPIGGGDGGYHYQIWTGEMNIDSSDWSEMLQRESENTIYAPQFQVAGNTIYYTWEEAVKTEGDVFSQIWRATMDIDNSLSWLDSPMTTTLTDKYSPQLQVVDDTVYYIWEESEETYDQICIASAETAVDGEWQVLAITDSAFHKDFPQLQVSGQQIYCVWSEAVNLCYEICTSKIDTQDGELSTILRTDDGFNRGLPQFQVVGGKIYYVWDEFDWTSHQIGTGEMGSNILSKGDFYGMGIRGNSVSGYINAGVDGFKYKGEAVTDTAGQFVEYDISNDWNHIAVTYNLTDLVLYVDGERVDSVHYEQLINTNDFDLLIGDDFDGTIDEIHVIDTALSRDWKKTCANNELDPADFYDIGSEESNSVGNRVWIDSDEDGIQDQGEAGISGVTVNLYSTGPVLVGTTTTDASGIYEFSAIQPGDYYLTFVLPSGYSFSPLNQGGDDTLDSDVNTVTGQTTSFKVEPGVSYPDWDAGIYPEIPPKIECIKLVQRIIDADGNMVTSPGDTLRYVIEIKNTGDGKANGVIFSDNPDDNTTLIPGVYSSQGSVITGSLPGDGTVGVNLGDIQSNGSAIIAFAVIVNTPVYATQISNQALVECENYADTLSDDPATNPLGDPTMIYVVPSSRPLPANVIGGEVEQTGKLTVIIPWLVLVLIVTTGGVVFGLNRRRAR